MLHAGASAPPVDVLASVSAIPAHLTTQFVEPISIVSPRAGRYLVLDRRAHTVFALSTAGDVRALMPVGWAPGQLLQPQAMSLGTNGILAVLDSPRGAPRIQYFGTDGMHVGGFFLPLPGAERLAADDFTVRGLAAQAFADRTFVVNDPTWGTLMTEFDTAGAIVRRMGDLRPTAGGADPAAHFVNNAGLPLFAPNGDLYFVFQTGVPAFRKYSKAGVLLFERHIEGPELDARILALPNTWPLRAPDRRPVASALVRTAAVDRLGQLWVSLYEPYTYVYSPAGDKLRVVQFRGASTLSPSSLFFTATGRAVVTPGGYEFDTK